MTISRFSFEFVISFHSFLTAVMRLCLLNLWQSTENWLFKGILSDTMVKISKACSTILTKTPSCRRLQPANKLSSFNHLPPSFHDAKYTYSLSPIPCAACAPRPWGMQPNTSFHLHMCISPLMLRPNIIPFSPCILKRVAHVKTIRLRMSNGVGCASRTCQIAQGSCL